MDMNKLMAKINAKRKTFVKTERPVSPKLGSNKLVILPGWNPESPETFWREFGAHFIKNPDGTTAGFYPCDEVIYGRECPVCQALAQASRMTSDDATLDLIKKARAGTQFLVNAIVIGENGNNPVVFSLSKTAFEQLMNVICSWGQAVFDPTAPQVVEINRTGSGFDTRYMVTVTPEKFPLPADIMSKIKNLDEYVDQRTDAMAKKAILGIAGITGTSVAMLGYSEPVQASVLPAARTISHDDLPTTGYTAAPTAPVTPTIPQASGVNPMAAQAAPAQAPSMPMNTMVPPAPTASNLDPEMDELLAGLDGL